MGDPIQAAITDLAPPIVRDWMKHLGYGPDEIAAAEAQDHEPECEFTGEYWECYDENGRSYHPIRDEMDDDVALVMFVLGHPSLAGGQVREEEGLRLNWVDGEPDEVDHFSNEAGWARRAFAHHQAKVAEDPGWRVRPTLVSRLIITTPPGVKTDG